MKIGVLAKLMVVGKASRDYTRKDNTKGTMYSVAVMQNGECTNIGVTEDVFNSVEADYVNPVTFGGYYDDKYSRFVIDSIVVPANVQPDANGKQFDVSGKK